MINLDVKGRVRRIEQRTPCVQGGEHIRNFESFDVELSPRGLATQITHYTGGGSIHGFEKFVYNHAGKLLHKLTCDGRGSQTGSTEFDHDREGRCVGWEARDRHGVVTTRCVRRYRGELLVSSITSLANGVPLVEKMLEYSGNNLLRTITDYYTANGDHKERSISCYDSKGRVVESFGQTTKGTPLGDGRYKYEYDDEGHRIRTWMLDEWANDDVPTAVTIFEYSFDELGNWIRRCTRHQSKNDSDWTKQITTRRLTYHPSS